MKVTAGGRSQSSATGRQAVRMSMLHPQPSQIVRPSSDQTPLLLVVVDTEAEFDWSGPLSRSAMSVHSVRAQLRCHDIFGRYGIRPIYVVDYAVASQPEGYQPLRELHQSGHCEIGAHLQPWANPPYEEDIGKRQNSYVGNLPAPLEREKLARLTEVIEANFGQRPRLYRAGRFGVGPATAATLVELGYQYDTSVVPYTDFRDDGGPDFSRCGIHPYWCGPGNRLLEIPLTVGYTGMLADLGPRLYPRIAHEPQRRWHIPGILAHLKLLERVRLTPEGITFPEHRRLTRSLLGRGCRVFSFTYHSPSLEPGNTPYVRTQKDLDVFLDTIERYFDYFFGEVGGRAADLADVRRLALAAVKDSRQGDHTCALALDVQAPAGRT